MSTWAAPACNSAARTAGAAANGRSARTKTTTLGTADEDKIDSVTACRSFTAVCFRRGILTSAAVRGRTILVRGYRGRQQSQGASGHDLGRRRRGQPGRPLLPAGLAPGL